MMLPEASSTLRTVFIGRLCERELVHLQLANGTP